MSQLPLVSILLPAYNAEKFIANAVNSMLDQTYSNIEIIVINDGSTDSTEKIVLEFKDPRVILHNNDGNIGLIATLNKGIDLCNGKYIARMDADDISYPERIKLQVNKMESDSSIGICGTAFDQYSANTLYKSHEIRPDYPLDNDTIQVNLLHHIRLCHGTAIFKKEVLEKFKFDSDYSHAEDFELWTRIQDEYQMANIPESMYCVYQHGDNVSIVHNDTQSNNTIKIIANQLSKFAGSKVSKKTAELYRRFCYSDFVMTKDEIIVIGELINQLNNNNNNNNTVPKLNLNNPIVLAKYLNSKWNHLCGNNINQKQIISVWRKYSLIPPNLSLVIKLRLKKLFS